jgi:hypothetical protein
MGCAAKRRVKRALEIGVLRMKTNKILLSFLTLIQTDACTPVQTHSIPSGAFSAKPPATQPGNEFRNSAVSLVELQKGLMSALGDSFEYIGGDVGRIETRVGSWEGEWFWFARVRAKEAGRFAFSYAVNLDMPAPSIRICLTNGDKAVYTVEFEIGERGGRREISPGAYGGSAWPVANVGDTVVIPVHIDRYRVGHTFAKLDPTDSKLAVFFDVAGQRGPEAYGKRGATQPVIRNDVPDWLSLLDSWQVTMIPESSKGSRLGYLAGYLEFKREGKFNVICQLDDPKEQTGVSNRTTFFVLPKNGPITALVEDFAYFEYTGNPNSPSNSVGSGVNIPPGTLQVRVGDRVIFGSGVYVISAGAGAGRDRTGIVTTQPVNGL